MRARPARGARAPPARDPGPDLGPRPAGRAVRAADRRGRRRLRARDRPGRPAGLRLGLDGSAIAIIAGLVFFNASVVIRVVGRRLGVARPAPGRGRGRARCLAVAGAARRHLPRPATGDRVGRHGRLPLLRHGVRDRAHPRRAALLERRDPDLPAHHRPPRPPGRGRPLGPAARGRHRPAARGGPRPPYAGRHGRPRPRAATAPAPGDLPALVLTGVLVVLVALPLTSLVVAACASTAPGAWPTTAPCRPPAPTRPCSSRSRPPW